MNQRATANNATTDRKRKRKQQPTSMTAPCQQEDQAIDKLLAKSKWDYSILWSVVGY